MHFQSLKVSKVTIKMRDHKCYYPYKLSFHILFSRTIKFLSKLQLSLKKVQHFGFYSYFFANIQQQLFSWWKLSNNSYKRQVQEQFVCQFQLQIIALSVMHFVFSWSLVIFSIFLSYFVEFVVILVYMMTMFSVTEDIELNNFCYYYKL